MYPTRVFSVFLWFFGLVVVGCYTGNLAGFLTETVLVPPNIEKYGGSDGYRVAVLANSSIDEKIFKILMRNATQVQHWYDTGIIQGFANYSAGIRSIQHQKIIILGTSLVLDYHRKQDPECRLDIQPVRPGPTLYYANKIHQPLAFPMRADWRHAQDFYKAMGKLIERGEVQLMYKEWITNNDPCANAGEDDDHISLGFDNFLGLFVLVALGVIISFIFLAIKLCHLKLKEFGKKEQKDSGDMHDVWG